MGETTGARQSTRSGKYFCTSRTAEGQQVEMMMSWRFSPTILSYSLFTR